MTNTERLKKAIEKAIEKGFCHTEHSKWIYANLLIASDSSRYEFYIPIIFSRSFAKAFWGENQIITKEKIVYELAHKNATNVTVNNPNLVIWQYHQHKMLDEVQAGREPLKYLEKYL